MNFIKNYSSYNPALSLIALYEIFKTRYDWQRLIKSDITISLTDTLIPLIGYYHPKHPCLIAIDTSEETTLLFQSTPVLTTAYPANQLIYELAPYLHRHLAPQTVLHGVFMEVLGKGILLMGEPGCGKSTIAQSLLARGARLIADDAPIFYSPQPFQVSGFCPPALLNLLEIRGLGIIDVRKLYGPLAITAEKTLDLIINLSNIDYACPRQLYPVIEQQHLFNIPIKSLNLPFALSENTAILIENTVKIACV